MTKGYSVFNYDLAFRNQCTVNTVYVLYLVFKIFGGNRFFNMRVQITDLVWEQLFILDLKKKMLPKSEGKISKSQTLSFTYELPECQFNIHVHFMYNRSINLCNFSRSELKVKEMVAGYSTYWYFNISLVHCIQIMINVQDTCTEVQLYVLGC